MRDRTFRNIVVGSIIGIIAAATMIGCCDSPGPEGETEEQRKDRVIKEYHRERLEECARRAPPNSDIVTWTGRDGCGYAMNVGRP